MRRWSATARPGFKVKAVSTNTTTLRRRNVVLRHRHGCRRQCRECPCHRRGWEVGEVAGIAENSCSSGSKEHTFTGDHSLAAKALRIPMGWAGAMAGPYTASTDLIQKSRGPRMGPSPNGLLWSFGIQLGGFGSILAFSAVRNQHCLVERYTITVPG
jgi:hypothetical protein